MTNLAPVDTYVELNDKLTYALRPLWDRSNSFAVLGNATVNKVTLFGTLPVIPGMPATSDARLAVSDDKPYTGGTAYVLDTSSKNLDY